MAPAAQPLTQEQGLCQVEQCVTARRQVPAIELECCSQAAEDDLGLVNIIFSRTRRTRPGSSP